MHHDLNVVKVGGNSNSAGAFHSFWFYSVICILALFLVALFLESIIFEVVSQSCYIFGRVFQYVAVCATCTELCSIGVKILLSSFQSVSKIAELAQQLVSEDLESDICQNQNSVKCPFFVVFFFLKEN